MTRDRSGLVAHAFTENDSRRSGGGCISSAIRNSKAASWSGSGRSNGQDGYTFKATVVDNGQGSGSNKTPDTINLIIRDSSGATVFATGGPVALRSGNIVVHL